MYITFWFGYNYFRDKAEKKCSTKSRNCQVQLSAKPGSVSRKLVHKSFTHARYERYFLTRHENSSDSKWKVFRHTDCGVLYTVMFLLRMILAVLNINRCDVKKILMYVGNRCNFYSFQNKSFKMTRMPK